MSPVALIINYDDGSTYTLGERENLRSCYR